MTKGDVVITQGTLRSVRFGDSHGGKALNRLTAFPQDIQEKPSYLYGYLDSNTTTAQLMLGISCCGSRLQKSHENKSATEKKAYMLVFRCCFREEKCTKHKVYSTPSRKL